VRLAVLLGVLGILAPLWSAGEDLGTAFSKEGQQFDENCVGLKLPGCAQTLFTGNPLHLAVGSLAPQNGFGTGLAFVAHSTPNKRWRLFWNADAVATPNGSWRAGGYLSAVYIRRTELHMGAPTGKKSNLALREMPVFHAYAQGTSLNSLSYYSLGQGTSRNPTYFGMTETVVGGKVVWPLLKGLNLSLVGEANARLFSLRGNNSGNNVSIDQRYDNVSAPGLSAQPEFGQFTEGIRIRPQLANGYVRLNYTASFSEWVSSNSTYSFRRFNADLSHQFPLYRSTRSLLPHEFNGPDTCATDPSALQCPSISRNLEGSFGLRLLYTTSYTSSGSVVPFYLDPTIGGSDINGTTLLPSLPDYRFRGPNLLVLRGSFEHSIYKWPVGVKFMVDEGRVSMTPGTLGFHQLAHSYAAGITLHAGGLPLVDILFAWGGNEGTHTIANVSPSLLGGTARPSLQ
jgi:hypothetical protein